MLGLISKKQYDKQMDILKVLSLYYALQQKGSPEGSAMILAQDVFGDQLGEEEKRLLYQYQRRLEDLAAGIVKGVDCDTI